ncbi:MAG: glycoside hydrolase family 127 protein [Roseburia sp.]|nr:glycoside hydrolase family 127 protein [Roseburia sp.]
MNQKNFSLPLSLRDIRVTDDFWKNEMELVRREVIPYQWEALNDRVAGAAPSFCMRNFKIAGKLNREKAEKGTAYEAPKYTFRGFEALPEDPEHLEDKFYGFVFQDSDFSKWIEAVGYSLTQHPDAALEQIADDAIDIVCAAQQEDGYLDTYYIINGRDKTFTNLRDHHELYCFGHLTEGAVAYYEATGKDKLLRAAERFADYIDAYFGAEEGKCKGYPGHEIAEMALVRLYEATGKRKYLDLSSFFVEQRGTKPYYFDTEGHPKESIREENGLRYAYNQAHLPVREQDEAVGHAVRAVYLYCGMADVARQKADESLFDACERLWDNIVGRKMYITGGIGATHMGEAFSFAYDLPNDTAYAETCASIGLVFFARRMLELTPDAKYANVMERALYNGVLSGMALDGKSFFYVNPLEVNPTACHKDERKFHVKPVRQKWFGCACCPPNLARLLSSIGAYAYTESEDTLFLHLYIGSALTKRIGTVSVDVDIRSRFPWEGDVEIRVRAKGSGLKLALRIPDWCGAYRLEDAESYTLSEQDGYLYITREWGEEDTIRISYPMEACLMEASGAVREDVGRAALVRGPVVYCLEEADNGADLHLLSVNSESAFSVVTEELCGLRVNKIRAEGTRRVREKADAALYRPLRPAVREKTTLTYIPYFAWANRGENEMQVWTRVE